MIAFKLKSILSRSISLEQFSFPEGRKIHEATREAYEGLHNIKTQNLKGVVIKINLSKAFDWVNNIYIRLLLTHVGFNIDFINWVMRYIQIVSFTILINGSASPFFHAQRGLRQGCTLSPSLFLLVPEGLKFLLYKAKRRGSIHGRLIVGTMVVTHFLFVGDILIFYNGIPREIISLASYLSLYGKETMMMISRNPQHHFTISMKLNPIIFYNNFSSL